MTTDKFLIYKTCEEKGGNNFISNEKKLSETPVQISTPYSSFTGGKTLHTACRVAAGKYNLLLSICVNLHPLWYITRAFILTLAMLLGLQTATPYLTHLHMYFQYNLLSDVFSEVMNRGHVPSTKSTGGPPPWWALHNKLDKLFHVSLQWFHSSKWAENWCTNTRFPRNGKPWMYVSRPLQ